MTGYAARVWDGSAWQPVGTQIADLTPYATDSELAAIGAWQSYTPVWAAETGGTPSYGTLANGGSLKGRYARNGNTVTAVIDLILGSDLSLGTTTLWNFSLPTNSLSGYKIAGSATWRGTYYGVGQALGENSGSSPVVYPVYGDGASASNFVGYNKPWNWASKHWLHMTVTYEGA